MTEFIRILVFLGHEYIVILQTIIMSATAQGWKKLNKGAAKFYNNPKYFHSNTSSKLLSWKVSKLSFIVMLNVEQPWYKKKWLTIISLHPPWELCYQILVM